MRLLADENFPFQLIALLKAAGHDILWVRTACPGERDSVLLERAEAEGRVILTLDRDFWQITLQRRSPLKNSGVVLFRTHPATFGNLRPLVELFLELDRSWKGQLSIVSSDGVQMMNAPVPR